jgi:pimeloyl-ACP methyl ester carboxylesterase
MKIKDILFIHGITSFGNSHIALNRKLTRLGYNFHSFDLPGHGEKKSQWINHIFKFEDMVEFVVKYIEKNLKNKPFIILGHSMGGGITQVISKIFKKQVKFVIFECPFSLAMKIGSENEKYKSLMKLDRIKIKKNVDSDLEKYKNINSTDVSRILEK